MIALLIGTGMAFWGLSQIRIEFSFDSFYPKDDPDFQYYAEFSEEFTEINDYLIIIALQHEDGDIFDADFLKKADSTFQQFADIDGIDSAAIATQIGQIRRRGLGYKTVPFLSFKDQKAVEKSRSKLRKDSLFASSFISQDSSWLCSYFFLRQDLFDRDERDNVNNRIDEVIAQSELPIQISGIPYIRTRYVEKLRNELMMFVSLAAMLLVVCLAFLYRTTWGVIAPLGLALGAIAWTLGLMGVTNEPITILSNLLIPVMFVVAMSDVIHIITKYLAMIELGFERKEALKKALRQVGFATFLTSLTTAIGFGALMVSKINPMRMFGLYAAIGVLVTFVVTMIALAWVLPRLRPEQIANPRKGFAASGNWSGWLLKLDRWIAHNQRGIIVSSLLLLLFAGWMTSRIPLNNYLLEDMNKKDLVRLSMQFFENQFGGGVRTFEMAFEAKQENEVDELIFLSEIKKIENYLGKTGLFAPFVSPITIVENSNYAYHFNRPQYRSLPDSQHQVDELLSAIRLQGGAPLLDLVFSENKKRARLSSRLPDLGTEAFYEFKSDFEAFVKTEIDTSIIDIQITGYSALTENNLEYLRQSLLEGLLIAFVLVAVIMGLLFRSWKMLFVSLVPNLAPLLLTGSVMGLFGITLSSSTAIVFVVAFGIAVDDTIHFLTRFKLEFEQSKDIDKAIRNTILGTGKAIIITSIVLLGGFILLLASDFGGTFNTGFFTALTILFAVFADLLLLPVLLRLVYRKNER
jgi:predicted RND superfamily exporter protein